MNPNHRSPSLSPTHHPPRLGSLRYYPYVGSTAGLGVSEEGGLWLSEEDLQIFAAHIDLARRPQQCVAWLGSVSDK